MPKVLLERLEGGGIRVVTITYHHHIPEPAPQEPLQDVSSTQLPDPDQQAYDLLASQILTEIICFITVVSIILLVFLVVSFYKTKFLDSLIYCCAKPSAVARRSAQSYEPNIQTISSPTQCSSPGLVSSLWHPPFDQPPPTYEQAVRQSSVCSDSCPPSSPRLPA